MKLKLFFLVILAVLNFSFVNISDAAFTLSGSTITQTGTNDTASFLANIGSNGATVTTYGNTPHSTFYIVDFGNNSLVVDGDLDIDFNRMTFVFTGSDATERLYARNGSLKLRSSQIENGFTFNPEVGTVIFALDEAVNWNSRTLRVDNTGDRSEFIGVTFKGEFSAWIYGNARFENCIMEKIGNTGDIQFNVEGNTELVDIKKYDSGQTGVTFRGDSRNVLIENVQIFGARDSFNNESSYTVTVDKLDSDTGAVADISQFSNKHHTVKNAKNGTRFLWANHLNGGSSTNYNSGRIEVIQELSVQALDTNGNTIENAKLYIEDNPQLAVSDNTTHILEVFDTQSSQTQRIYEKTTNTSGEIATFEILTGEGKSNGGDPLNGKIRSRGKNPKAFFFNQPETDDIFDYGFISYGFNIINNEVILRGVNGSNINAIFIKDTSVTETNKTTVDAYTTIDTSQQFYDRAKSHLVDNYAGETDTIVTREENVINAGSYNVIIDATAAQAFDFDGSTITIKSNEFLGELVTTGNISFSNGSVQGADYTDSTGFYPLDNTDPSITITSQVPSKIDNQGITIDIQATDDREIILDDVQVSLANTTAGVANFICAQTSTTQVDCTLQVLSSGNVEIRAEDARGLSTTELDLNYIIDTEAPDITAGLNTTGPFSPNSPEVTFSATDNISAPGDIDFTVSVDDGPFVTQSSPYTPPLVGDRHIIVIKAADELGNESEFSFVYTPLLTITAPTTTSNADIADTTITASSINDLTDVTITGAGSTFVCTPDPTPATPSSGPVTCTGIITTTGTLDISATDTLITDSTDISYIIERTPPVIVITAPTTSGTDGITDTTITVTDDVAVNANDVFIDGTSSSAARLFNCTQTSTTQVDCTIDIASSGNLVILARDRSDNESMEAQAYTVIPAGFSPTSSGGGSGGSNSLMLCTSDPTAANYYGGDLDLDVFRFYKIVKRCIYGNQSQEVAIAEIIEEVTQQPVEITYEKPQCTINYSRLIKRGLRGNDVKQVQRCMNSLGYTSGPEDGIYGSLTYAGITAYQRAHKLKYIDGIVGPETSGSLNDLGDVTVTGI